MRMLVVSHGMRKELELAEDYINGCGNGAVQPIFANEDLVVDLDAVREWLPNIDALVLIQCEKSAKATGPGEESELQRVERLAVTEAAEAGKLVGIIGKERTLLAKHLRTCAHLIRIVGLYQEKTSLAERFGSSFPKADIVSVHNMLEGARVFTWRLDSFVRQKTAA